MHSQEHPHIEQSTSAQNGKNTELFNADVVQRIDSLIFGYFQRMGYEECSQSLSRESVYLSSEQRKIQFGGQTIISLNDRVHDRTLEDIVLLFIQDGRFDISREMLDFGESLRQLSNKYTSMTMQSSMSRSDMHQKLYGKPSISRHNQPTGYMSSYPRGNNYSTYTLQQSAVAKAQIEQQLLIQQAETRYRQQQQEQLQRQLVQQQMVSNQRVPDVNKTHTMPEEIPIAAARSEYHMDNSKQFGMNDNKQVHESVSSHSEGSARRKLVNPQNFSAKLRESIIDPIVGMCNDKAWDNVSDIHLDESSLFPGLDVIGNSFLAQFDYYPEEGRMMNANEGRPIDDQFMADEFSNLGPIHPDNEFPITMMNVANEVEVNSSDDVEENPRVSQEMAPPAENEVTEEPVIENIVSSSHNDLHIQMGRMVAPEPLISPIESIKSVRRASISDETKKPRRHDRSSSEISSGGDNKEKRHRDREKNKESHKEKKEVDRKEDEKRKSHSSSARRDGRESKSPPPKRDVVPKSRNERRSDDSPRRTEKRREGHSEEKYNEKNNQKRKDRDRMNDKNRDDRRNDRNAAKRPRIEERSSKNEKVDEVERSERRKDPRSQRDSKEKVDISRDIPNRSPAVRDGSMDTHQMHRASPDVESQKTNSSMKATSVDSKSKAATQMLNRLRHQTKATSKGNLEPIEAIFKDIAKSKENTPEPPSFIPKKQESIWKIPKKSSSNQNVISHPSTSSFSPSSSQHSVSSKSHAPAPVHQEKRKEKSKPVVEPAPQQSHRHAHDENAPLCDGDEREECLMFIEPKLSVIRLTSMMINCDEQYKNKLKETENSDGEINSPDTSSASTSAESVASSNSKGRSVNNHPKSVQYAPQKVNLYAAKKTSKSVSDDDEDDDDEKNDGEIDSDEDNDISDKQRKLKTLNLSAASALLDELPYEDE